jgi:hypothetical protein
VPLPRRLLAHLRRWVVKGIVSEYFVEWSGRPVKSVKTAFKTALGLAKVRGRISPHTLRHTAATWLMQNGVDKWEAAGFLGMSVEMLDRVYGHHHPEHLRGAAHALGYRRSQSLAITLAPSRRPRLPDRPNSLLNREINREFCKIRPSAPNFRTGREQIQWLPVKFPTLWNREFL